VKELDEKVRVFEVSSSSRSERVIVVCVLSVGMDIKY
jgi:hypothetical protein